MIYDISARLKPEHADELLRRLTDGSIQSFGPDGREAVDALNNAAISTDGCVHWNMGCFCNPPLARERALVFDHHFADLKINASGQRKTPEGTSFMKYLRRSTANS